MEESDRKSDRMDESAEEITSQKVENSVTSGDLKENDEYCSNASDKEQRDAECELQKLREENERLRSELEVFINTQTKSTRG